MLAHVLGSCITRYYITYLNGIWFHRFHHAIAPRSRDGTGESVSNRFFLSFSLAAKKPVCYPISRTQRQPERTLGSFTMQPLLWFLFASRFKFELFHSASHGFTYLTMGTDLFASIPYSTLQSASDYMFYVASRYCSSMFKHFPWNKLDRPGLEESLGLPVWDVQFQICQTDAELLHRARLWRFTRSWQGLQPN